MTRQENMPHIIVKLWPGRTEEQKKQLTGKLAEALRSSIDVPDSSISVSIEEIPKEKWNDEVCKPDIVGKKHLLYKKPYYNTIK